MKKTFILLMLTLSVLNSVSQISIKKVEFKKGPVIKEEFKVDSRIFIENETYAVLLNLEGRAPDYQKDYYLAKFDSANNQVIRKHIDLEKNGPYYLEKLLKRDNELIVLLSKITEEKINLYYCVVDKSSLELSDPELILKTDFDKRKYGSKTPWRPKLLSIIKYGEDEIFLQIIKSKFDGKQGLSILYTNINKDFSKVNKLELIPPKKYSDIGIVGSVNKSDEKPFLISLYDNKLFYVEYNSIDSQPKAFELTDVNVETNNYSYTKKGIYIYITYYFYDEKIVKLGTDDIDRASGFCVIKYNTKENKVEFTKKHEFSKEFIVENMSKRDKKKTLKKHAKGKDVLYLEGYTESEIADFGENGFIFIGIQDYLYGTDDHGGYTTYSDRKRGNIILFKFSKDGKFEWSKRIMKSQVKSRKISHKHDDPMLEFITNFDKLYVFASDNKKNYNYLPGDVVFRYRPFDKGAVVSMFEIDMEGKVKSTVFIDINKDMDKVSHPSTWKYISGDDGKIVYQGTNYADGQYGLNNIIFYLEEK